MCNFVFDQELELLPIRMLCFIGDFKEIFFKMLKDIDVRLMTCKLKVTQAFLSQFEVQRGGV